MAATDTSIELNQLSQAYGDAWNRQDLEGILAFHTDDCTFELHTGTGPAVGKQAVREAFAAFIAQFPDIHFAERRTMSGPGHWVFESTVTATLAQPLEVDGQRVEQNGARVEFDAVDVITVEEGLVKTKDTYVDALAIQRQLGIGPAEGS
jgi:steroid delta-isomerase-like uncharacterized protein